MKTKSKILIASAVLLGSSFAMAAPAQAHELPDPLWPLYGLTGIILHDATRHHDHYKHRYYDDHRDQYRHRRHHSYGWDDRHDRHDRDNPRRHR